MKFKILLSLLIINIVFSETEHNHNHNHNNELGIAVGIVPGHGGESDNLGLHLHYIKGVGEYNDFGIGISLETIFDDHEHNSISIIGTYHFQNGLTIAYAPGILFTEHNGHTEDTFTQHFELYYEIELEHFHVGPQIDIGFEDDETHYMLGLHFGIDF
tara:strand:- start:3 stop:476 length:474 start_codon:yes stop_codon:yes gene_type:complete